MRYTKIRKFLIKYHFYISFIIILIYLSPYLILWKNTPVRIHDNLESNVIYWKILVESGGAFADNHAIIPNMMSGLPRLSYGSEFQVIILLFYFLPPFVAYVINLFLIHIFAFLGMYLLLKNHFNINHDEFVNIIIIDGVSICFALLPFWPPGGLSIAGLPLALYAFLNIRFNKSTKRDWMILTLIPFYSSLILSFTFFITIIFLIFLKDCVINRIFNEKFLLALLYFGLLYLLIEYRLILATFFDKSYISHRSEFDFQERNFFDCIGISITFYILDNQTHSLSVHTFIMVYCVSIIILSYITLKIGNKEDFKEIKPKIWLLIKMFILAGVISIIYGFKDWNQLSSIKNKYQILIAFQWDRFYTLFPLIWYIIFAISLDISFFYVENLKILQGSLKGLNKNQKIFQIKIGKIVGIFLLILIIHQGIYNCSYNETHKRIFDKIVYDKDYISYEEFYAVEQFNEIKNDIKLPQEDYRIGCIGFHPAIALYNGFYTIDGYVPNYPLEYKHRFRYLISKELEKSRELSEGFDDWGSRCYILVAELGGDSAKVYKWKNKEIENLELNITALKDLKVNFIFSSVLINNYYENNLTLFNAYNHDISAWKIFVYEVKY